MGFQTNYTATLIQVRDEYIAWRTAQGFRPNTIKNDRTTLSKMMAALGENYVISEIDDRASLRVLEHAARNRQPASLNLIQSAMSVFYEYCRIRKYMPPDQNPLYGLRKRKVPQKERRLLALHEFPAFLDAAEDPRARFACALGLYLFPRASEVVNLRVKDLDLNAGTVGMTVMKTGDYDIMPISTELDREARRYLTYYTAECGPLDPFWYLVPARKPKGLNSFTLNPERKLLLPEEIVKRTLVRYGWRDTKNQGFHLLRASGARAWFDELTNQTIDGALKIVQAQLHHKSVAMTEHYLGITADRAKRDRIVKGESMFPSLEAGNVIDLNARRDAQ